MKTSIKLLILVAVVVLTGMASINVLLKKQYEQIDWSNPYQNFINRPLPNVHHVRIVGNNVEDVVLISTGNSPQAKLSPNVALTALQTTQTGDTLVITYKETSGTHQDGRLMDLEWYSPRPNLVIYMPNIEQISAHSIWLKLQDIQSRQLNIKATHARVETQKMRIVDNWQVTTEQGANLLLRADTCGTLQLTVRDSSRVRLGNIRPVKLLSTVEPRAELWVRGQALSKMR